MYMPVKFDRKMNMCVRGKSSSSPQWLQNEVAAYKSGRHKGRRLEGEGWATWISALAGAIVFGGAGILVGCPWT